MFSINQNYQESVSEDIKAIDTAQFSINQNYQESVSAINFNNHNTMFSINQNYQESVSDREEKEEAICLALIKITKSPYLVFAFK